MSSVPGSIMRAKMRQGCLGLIILIAIIAWFNRPYKPDGGEQKSITPDVVTPREFYNPEELRHLLVGKDKQDVKRLLGEPYKVTKLPPRVYEQDDKREVWDKLEEWSYANKVKDKEGRMMYIKFNINDNQVTWADESLWAY